MLVNMYAGLSYSDVMYIKAQLIKLYLSSWQVENLIQVLKTITQAQVCVVLIAALNTVTDLIAREVLWHVLSDEGLAQLQAHVLRQPGVGGSHRGGDWGH